MPLEKVIYRGGPGVEDVVSLTVSLVHLSKIILVPFSGGYARGIWGYPLSRGIFGRIQHPALVAMKTLSALSERALLLPDSLTQPTWLYLPCYRPRLSKVDSGLLISLEEEILGNASTNLCGMVALNFFEVVGLVAESQSVRPHELRPSLRLFQNSFPRLHTTSKILFDQ